MCWKLRFIIGQELIDDDDAFEGEKSGINGGCKRQLERDRPKPRFGRLARDKLMTLRARVKQRLVRGSRMKVVERNGRIVERKLVKCRLVKCKLVERRLVREKQRLGMRSISVLR